MRAQRSLAGLLALVLLGLPQTSPALAEDPAPPRTLEEATTFRDAGDAALAVSRPQHTAAYRRWLNARIHAVKTELASLHARAFIARQLFDGPDETCEREEIERRYAQEKERLLALIAGHRDLRGGDARKWFTRLTDRVTRDIDRAWQHIGPLGRRILRQLGDEALAIVVSGGTLRGGAARRLLVGIGRREAPGLILAALERTTRQQDAAIAAAAREACAEEARQKTAAAAMLPKSAPLGEGGCPPRPPYGVPAYVIEFTWDQPVRVNYGVATEVDPLDATKPQLWAYLHGDVAVTFGGCGDPSRPLLITRRDQSRGSVDPSVQAETGVGTYSVCATGGDWAGQERRNEVPGQPWTYTIVVEGNEPCEGAFRDLPPEYPDIPMWRREMPESTTVTATVTYYPAMSTVPSGESLTLTAEVGVLNAIALDNAQYHAVEYQRPPPVVLGQVTLPAIDPEPAG